MFHPYIRRDSSLVAHFLILFLRAYLKARIRNGWDTAILGQPPLYTLAWIIATRFLPQRPFFLAALKHSGQILSGNKKLLRGITYQSNFGTGDRTRVHYGAPGVEPPGGNSPPDCCIYMGSSLSPGYQKREPRGALFFGAGIHNGFGFIGRNAQILAL